MTSVQYLSGNVKGRISNSKVASNANSKILEATAQKKSNIALNKQSKKSIQSAERARGQADLARKDYVMYSILDVLYIPLETVGFSYNSFLLNKRKDNDK